MQKVKIEPINLRDHMLFIEQTLIELHATPKHLLINSLIGLATNIVDLTAYETDMDTMGVAILHIVVEALKENESEPDHLLTLLKQAGDVAGGTA